MRDSVRSRIAAVVVMACAALTAASCVLVGQGDLRISNDESGLGADNTIFRAYVADAGEPWPPPGYINIFVRGDDFGRPPSYGLDGYLYLVRTEEPCPQSEGAPEAFTLDEVEIVGIVTVTGGTVNQFVTMPDTPANRSSQWALMEIIELADFPGEHLLERCGTVTWM